MTYKIKIDNFLCLLFHSSIEEQQWGFYLFFNFIFMGLRAKRSKKTFFSSNWLKKHWKWDFCAHEKLHHWRITMRKFTWIEESLLSWYPGPSLSYPGWARPCFLAGPCTEAQNTRFLCNNKVFYLFLFITINRFCHLNLTYLVTQ